MTEVTPLPTSGGAFFDARDEGRSLRMSWHKQAARFVLSLWREDRCVGSCWLTATEMSRLVAATTAALADAVESSDPGIPVAQ